MDGLANERSNRFGSLSSNRLLEFFGEMCNEFNVGESRVITILMWCSQVNEPWSHRTEIFPVGRNASCSQARVSNAVVRHSPREHLDALRLTFERPVVTGNLDCGLVRFCAARGELKVRRAGKHLGQFRSEFDHRWTRQTKKCWHERNLLDLISSGIGKHTPPVTDIDVPQACETIQVRFAGRVPNPRAFTTGQHQRSRFRVAMQIRYRMQNVRKVLFDQAFGVPGHG